MTGQENERRLKRLRLAMLVILALSSGLYGLRVALLPQEWIADRILILTMSLAVTWFCRAESKLAGQPLAISLQWIILFTWPISAPMYLISWRGSRGLLLSLLLFALFAVPICVAFLIAEYIFGVEFHF